MRNVILPMLCALLLATHGAFAQSEPKFYASAEPSTAMVGERVEVVFTLENVNSGTRLASPDWAALGFALVNTSQSTSMTIQNGKTQSTAVYRYIVSPLDTGLLTIPALSIRNNGLDLSSSPLSIRVTANPDGIPPVHSRPYPEERQVEPRKKIKTIRM